ncbi:Calcium-binding and coiled-coil domain-containing protein 1 [Mycena venus]|uniref:Calcium-binding and coiled-coil domain-containing protein 1 n=1 Tax=Mycena venus TaxID=2733690 RepID=A0A8H7CIZ3_9AGAR|nr:Calcium-binding and coiled-coil domain-containing protein 1 [Mycena venus]
MWVKLTQTFKLKQVHDGRGTSSHGEVLADDPEQYPIPAVVHRVPASIGPPRSFSTRPTVLKRHAKDNDELKRAPSLMTRVASSFGTQKHVVQSLADAERGPTSSHNMPTPRVSQHRPQHQSSFNVSKRSSLVGPHSPTTTENIRSPPRIGEPRASGHDRTTKHSSLVGPHSPTTTEHIRSPPRIDEPRASAHDRTTDPATPFQAKSGSVHFVPHHDHTPGTGQNVRHASRVQTPDESVGNEDQSVVTHPVPNSTPAPAREMFLSKLERLKRLAFTDRITSTPMKRLSTKPETTVSDIFSPMSSLEDTSVSQVRKSDSNGSQLLLQLPPLPAPGFTDLFQYSQDLELPISTPPGLGRESEMSLNAAERESEGNANAITSVTYLDKKNDKKVDLPKENLAPTGVDGSIFTAREKSHCKPFARHDPSTSFSIGPNSFSSMPHDDFKWYSTSSKLENDCSLRPSSAMLSRSCPSLHQINVPRRALMPMPRSPSPTPLFLKPDINRESSLNHVVHSVEEPEPNPFRANASTYHTPQTKIPATPPQGGSATHAADHAQKASKEESLICGLKTQLAVQTGLCDKFKTDLRARDELVEVLGKKLREVEGEEARKRSVLKEWKKKVVDLERTCRYLEEEVEGSRQESMERSILDEASSQALKILHRQIAGLERDKESSKRREERFRNEVATLELQLRQKSDDVMRLNETLWSREESVRELEAGIQEAKAREKEIMGNLSIGLIDGKALKNELKNTTMARDRCNGEDREGDGKAESGWEEEKAHLLTVVENAKLENAGLGAELHHHKQRLKEQDDELAKLKSELDARYDHSKNAAEKMEAVEAAKRTADEERDTLHAKIAQLEDELIVMKAENVEFKTSRIELENVLQGLWEAEEALEKKRQENRDQDNHVQSLQQTLQARQDRVVELERDRQYAQDNVVRLQEEIQLRDEEAANYSQHVHDLWDVKEALEKEREELRGLNSDQDGHMQALRQTLQTREDRIVELDQERQYALDNVTRLEENIRRRDAEMAEYSQRILEREAAAESLREQMSRMKRENVSALEAMTAAQTAEAQKQTRAARELKDEIERLQRQIQDLKQESADKEIKIVQLTEQRAQDKGDLQGLNIALDSKQQELELVSAETRQGLTKYVRGATESEINIDDREIATPLGSLQYSKSRLDPGVRAVGCGYELWKCKRRQDGRSRAEIEC